MRSLKFEWEMFIVCVQSVRSIKSFPVCSKAQSEGFGVLNADCEVCDITEGLSSVV